MIAKSSFFHTVLTMAGHKEVIPIAFVSIEQDANFFWSAFANFLQTTYDYNQASRRLT